MKTCGIKVSVLCPGPTRTAFYGTAQMDTAKLDRTDKLMSPEEVALHGTRYGTEPKPPVFWSTQPLDRLQPALERTRWLTRKIAGAINKAYCPR